MSKAQIRALQEYRERPQPQPLDRYLTGQLALIEDRLQELQDERDQLSTERPLHYRVRIRTIDQLQAAAVGARVALVCLQQHIRKGEVTWR